VPRSPLARLGSEWATDLLDVTSDVSALDGTGRWAVAIPYDGEPVCARFGSWSADPGQGRVGAWRGPSAGSWRSSMEEPAYVRAVAEIREAIAAGSVYQANLCRVMSAPMPGGDADDVAALGRLLAAGNPSPYGGFLRLPDHGVAIASASPELFVSRHATESGTVVRSGPIKGTGRTVADLTDKDTAENVMIVDLVRNDLSRVSVPGSVTVPELLQVQEHPGLVHLVSYVQARLTAGTTWHDLLDATFPPGSVTGAPKLAALDIIGALEPVSREYYCGAFGWVDADTGEAELAVAIRTFWLRDGLLRFGTGAGITWGSDAGAEWRETELKAARLVGLASGSWQAGAP
jgi:para-aminobenzoate synthetase component 1